MACAESVFPAGHPAAAGHFPGDPIMPGALLLAEALRAIEVGTGLPMAACRIRSAKFLAPVRPGERIVIEFERARGQSIRFACAAGGRAVLTGEVACAAAPATT